MARPSKTNGTKISTHVDSALSTKRAEPSVMLEKSPIHLIHRAGQCAGDIFQTEMTDSDLTPRQLAVLASVSQNEGLSQTNLVAMTGIDRSTLADIVRRMLKKGFLQRRRAKQDARAYSVKLTDEGRKALHTAEPVAKRIDDRILSALPATARKRFLQDLVLIVDELGKPDPHKPASKR